MENCLRHDGDPPAHNCRFGVRLEGEGQTHYGQRAEYQAITVLHREVHERAQILLDLKAEGKVGDALNGIADLHQLRDTLLEQLRLLV